MKYFTKLIPKEDKDVVVNIVSNLSNNYVDVLVDLNEAWEITVNFKNKRYLENAIIRADRDFEFT